MTFDTLLNLVDGPARDRLTDLMNRVKPADLAPVELLALVAVLEPVAERLEATVAPALTIAAVKGEM